MCEWIKGTKVNHGDLDMISHGVWTISGDHTSICCRKRIESKISQEKKKKQ